MGFGSGLWASVKHADAHSVPARLGHVLTAAWRSSRVKAFWDRSVTRSGISASQSWYARRLAAFNAACHRFGTRALHPAWDVSIPRNAAGSARFSLSNWALRLGSTRWMLLLMACMLPLDVLFRRVLPLGSAASLWDKAYFALLLLFIPWRLMMARVAVKARPSVVDGAIIIFGGIGFFLMFANAPDLRIAFDGLRATAFFIPMFFVSHRLIADEGDLMAFIVPFAFIGTLVALHGIYQYIVGTPIPYAWVAQTEMGVRTRAFSILGSPNIKASFLIMTAPPAVALAYMAGTWFANRAKWQKIGAQLMLFAAGGAMCLGCLVTFSRGGWLGMVVAIVVFALLRDRRLLMLFLAVLAVAVFIPEITNRIAFLFTSDFAEGSMRAGRAIRWEIGWDLLSRNPILGFGLGRFGGAVAMQNQVIEGMRYFYMDNYYLKTLVEMGWLGLSGYLFLLASLLVSGIRAYTRVYGDPRLRAMASALLASLAGVLAHCLFENIFEVPYMLAYFWMLGGALLALPYVRGGSPHSPAGGQRPPLQP
jgi:O-antigen ligase